MVRSKASERDKRKTYYEEHQKAPPRIFQREQRTKRISAPCCIPLSLAGLQGARPLASFVFFFTIITEALWQGTTLYRPPNTTTTKYLINKKKTRHNYNYSTTRISSNIGQRQSKAAIYLDLHTFFGPMVLPAHRNHHTRSGFPGFPAVLSVMCGFPDRMDTEGPYGRLCPARYFPGRCCSDEYHREQHCLGGRHLLI